MNLLFLAQLLHDPGWNSEERRSTVVGWQPRGKSFPRILESLTRNLRRSRIWRSQSRFLCGIVRPDQDSNPRPVILNERTTIFRKTLPLTNGVLVVYDLPGQGCDLKCYARCSVVRALKYRVKDPRFDTYSSHVIFLHFDWSSRNPLWFLESETN